MFTGIITNTGIVKKRSARGLEIAANASFVRQLKKGDSVSVNGACLTVTVSRVGNFTADVMRETWERTMLGTLKQNAIVNLELPLKANSFISGHFVQGHVDGVAKVSSIKKVEDSHIISFETSKEIASHLVEKGSVTINGVSLTIINSKNGKFSVGVIPHTWDKTMFNKLKVGELVNIEVDVLAKYTKKFIKLQNKSLRGRCLNS